MGTMFKTKKPIAISTTLQKVFRNEGVSGEFAKFSKALKTKKEQSAQKLNAPTNAELDRADKTFEDIKKQFSEEINKCQASNETNMYRMAEPKYLLIIRIKGINKVAPKQKLILRLMRLRQINNAVFVKVSKATINMLKFIEPYVTYGTPSPQTVHALLHKRGYIKTPGGDRYNYRQRFTDSVVKTYMPEGINTITDVASSIISVGPDFKSVNSMIWPIKLSNPSGGFACKRHAYLEHRAGDWGNRGIAINSLVRKMM